MKIEKILEKVDHTILNTNTTKEEIKTLIDDAIEYNVASVCIPPSYVLFARDYAEGKIKICTVIGFPNGYNTTKTKIFETEDAILNGACEIDMVINIAELKNKNYDYVKNEIFQINKVCKNNLALLKVIIETAVLTEDEIIKMCEIVSELKVDFIKTSTGFSTIGASFNDVDLMKKNTYNNVKIKAAGGIQSFEDAQKFIELGADRLGTSRLIKILKEKKLMTNENVILLYKNLFNKLMIELDEEIYFLYSPMRVFKAKEKLTNADYLPVLHFDYKEAKDEISDLDTSVSIDDIDKNYISMTASQIIKEIKVFLENNK